MKNSFRKIMAWLLTLMMFISNVPVGALASVDPVGQSVNGVIIDVSDYVQVKDDLPIKPVSGSGTGGSIVVSSLDPITEGVHPVINGGATHMRKSAAVVSGSREIARFDISMVDEKGNKWQPADGQTLDVTVDLNEYLPINEGEKLSLIHYADGESFGEAVPATFITQDNKETGKKEITKFTFSTDGFSVYVVQGETVDNRLKVTFKDGENEIDHIYVKAILSLTKKEIRLSRLFCMILE